MTTLQMTNEPLKLSDDELDCVVGGSFWHDVTHTVDDVTHTVTKFVSKSMAGTFGKITSDLGIELIEAE
jgi:hypothetical protein